MNRGIAEAHREGIVTSASLLANGTAFAGATELARGEKNLGVGVHLNLSDGRPTLEARQVPSLVNGEGRFSGGPSSLLVRRLSRRLRLEEVEREWNAQIRKVLDAGVQPTHLDGHKHVQMLPGLFEVALRLAQRHGIRVMRIAHEEPLLSAALSNERIGDFGSAIKQGVQARGLRLISMNARAEARRAGIVTADFFCGITQTGLLNEEGLRSLIWNLPEGVTELMTHPGYTDGGLRETATRLQTSRVNELAILTSPEVRNVIASLGVRLVHYGFAAE